MNIPVWNKEKWKEENAVGHFPKYNSTGNLLVIGCNYHTTWQKYPSMRFVLTEIRWPKARLQTRGTRKDFWTNVDDLIFITSGYNNGKAKELTKS